jgi:hypothetical protein
MTQDEVIAMAREAGLTVCRDEWVFGEMLERFAQLVAAHERDQTKKVEAMFTQRTWVGLTDQEIENLWNQHEPRFDYYSFSCDIEAKLKEKNK